MRPVPGELGPSPSPPDVLLRMCSTDLLPSIDLRISVDTLCACSTASTASLTFLFRHGSRDISADLLSTMDSWSGVNVRIRFCSPVHSMCNAVSDRLLRQPHGPLDEQAGVADDVLPALDESLEAGAAEGDIARDVLEQLRQLVGEDVSVMLPELEQNHRILVDDHPQLLLADDKRNHVRGHDACGPSVEGREVGVGEEELDLSDGASCCAGHGLGHLLVVLQQAVLLLERAVVVAPLHAALGDEVDPLELLALLEQRGALGEDVRLERQRVVELVEPLGRDRLEDRPRLHHVGLDRDLGVARRALGHLIMDHVLQPLLLPVGDLRQVGQAVHFLLEHLEHQAARLPRPHGLGDLGVLVLHGLEHLLRVVPYRQALVQDLEEHLRQRAGADLAPRRLLMRSHDGADDLEPLCLVLVHQVRPHEPQEADLLHVPQVPWQLQQPLGLQPVPLEPLPAPLRVVAVI
eukprot:764124-Hanusia_phi.AAC.3